MTFTKDKAFSYEPIEVNGNKVFFDGKFRIAENALSIYRLYGDVTLFNEAIQNFCIVHNIGTAKIKN